MGGCPPQEVHLPVFGGRPPKEVRGGEGQTGLRLSLGRRSRHPDPGRSYRTANVSDRLCPGPWSPGIFLVRKDSAASLLSALPRWYGQSPVHARRYGQSPVDAVALVVVVVVGPAAGRMRLGLQSHAGGQVVQLLPYLRSGGMPAVVVESVRPSRPETAISAR